MVLVVCVQIKINNQTKENKSEFYTVISVQYVAALDIYLEPTRSTVGTSLWLQAIVVSVGKSLKRPVPHVLMKNSAQLSIRIANFRKLLEIFNNISSFLVAKLLSTFY